MEVKTVLITQARMGSSRLPGKVMLTIKDKSLLEIHLNRLSAAKKIDKIVVATTENPLDDIIEKKVIELGFDVFRGSEDDVLDRFYRTAQNYNTEYIVRVTSDCPIIDPQLIDEAINCIEEKNVDYVSNVIDETFPDGQDVEVFKYSALKYAWENASIKSDREHVTPFIRNNSNLRGGTLFKAFSLKSDLNFSRIRMTVDEIQDFQLMNKIINNLGVNATWIDYSEYILNNQLTSINGDILRNQGYIKSLKND